MASKHVVWENQTLRELIFILQNSNNFDAMDMILK